MGWEGGMLLILDNHTIIGIRFPDKYEYNTV